MELLNDRKAKYDEMQARKKAQEEKKAKFEDAMNNWDNLTVEQKKAAFDEAGCCGGCREGEGHGGCRGDRPGCHKGGHHQGGCHQGQAQGGCHKEGGKCPKGNH